MSKREVSMFAAQGVDIDAPRAKRHKPGQPSGSASSPPREEHDAPNGASAAGGKAEEGAKVKEDPEVVKERGLRLWQVIKDATSKEGRPLSHDFLRLPSKRQYPDYYEQIKRPIALDDIKRQLDSGQYAFFDEVKHDFEQCFKNAKKYNIRDSQIWKDAKHLHKLSLKEWDKLNGTQGNADGDGSGSEGEGEEGKKKKGPPMNRLLKTRLQKLISKTDDAGRVLSAEFMDLPNRKLWPSYYKVIKKPQCFENVFKHLKRKEYENPTDFANDVELIFANALEFNQEHTQIWDDAVVLREYFHQLMSDLPPPFTIPSYSAPNQSRKIRLKMPAASHVHPPGASTAPVAPAPAIATSSAIAPAPTASNTHAPLAAPTPTTARTAPPKTSTPLPPAPAISAAPSQSTAFSSQIPPTPSSVQPTYGQPAYNGTSSPYYPNAAYQSATPAASATAAHPSRGATQYSAPPLQPAQHANIISMPKSPTPPELRNRRQIRSVSVVTRPLGRHIPLDYRDGVKIWAGRLGKNETSVHIADVRLSGPGGEEEEESDDEGKGKDKLHERREEEEEEEDEEESHQKPRRGRGRPRKKRAKTTESPKGKGKAMAQLPAEIQVKLNGIVIDPQEDEKSAWDVEIPIGSNVVEVGEPEGSIWRVYLERL
ncbi:Bromodomain-containing protein [Trametopsis cervina]|nr:Bromodomain-containing protein [Trametopsis cervina]